MKKSLKIKQLWMIINAKYTLPEMMKYFGFSDIGVKKKMATIKRADIHDASSYFSLSHTLVLMAYRELIELKEIDGTKIFNLATHSFDGKNRHMDIGISKNNIYIYSNEQWKHFK